RHRARRRRHDGGGGGRPGGAGAAPRHVGEEARPGGRPAGAGAGPGVSDDALADYPKTVVLKDGAHLVLRPLGAAERGALGRVLAHAAPVERFAPDAEPGILACAGERGVAAAALERGAPGGARLGAVIDPGSRGRRPGTWPVPAAVHLAAPLAAARRE